MFCGRNDQILMLGTNLIYVLQQIYVIDEVALERMQQEEAEAAEAAALAAAAAAEAAANAEAAELLMQSNENTAVAVTESTALDSNAGAQSEEKDSNSRKASIAPASMSSKSTGGGAISGLETPNDSRLSSAQGEGRASAATSRKGLSSTKSFRFSQKESANGDSGSGGDPPDETPRASEFKSIPKILMFRMTKTIQLKSYYEPLQSPMSGGSSNNQPTLIKYINDQSIFVGFQDGTLQAFECGDYLYYDEDLMSDPNFSFLSGNCNVLLSIDACCGASGTVKSISIANWKSTLSGGVFMFEVFTSNSNRQLCHWGVRKVQQSCPSTQPFQQQSDELLEIWEADILGVSNS